MKKIMVLACALGLFGVASAQINPIAKSGVELKTQKTASSVVASPSQLRDAILDTVWSESTYKNEDGYIGVLAGEMPSGAYNLPYGSYWVGHLFGSGEYGYVYDHRPESFISTVANKSLLEGMHVTGVGAVIARLEGRVDDDAPVFFRVYTNDLIKKQSVIADFYGDDGTMMDVYYPTDPELGAVSDTVMVPYMEPRDGGFPGSDLFMAEFKTPVVLGKDNDFLAASMVIPAGKVGDTLYNVTALINVNSVNNPYLSEMPHSCFTVIDWNQQAMFYAEGSQTEPAREKPSYFDAEIQSNPRYSIIAMDAWKLNDGALPLNGEPQMFVAYSYATDVESPNAYDVKVSVSPVPATDFVTFRAFSNIQKVELFNMGGAMVVEQPNTGAEATVYLNGLNAGVYVAKVYTDGGIATKKIVVR